MITFKKERYGADVATIHEGDDQIVEVLRRKDGRFDLIVHSRRHDTDRWDDLTATLKPADLLALGEVADAYLCIEPECPSHGQPPSRSCKCHPRYGRP